MLFSSAHRTTCPSHFTMPASSQRHRTRWDSWPPTQMRLSPSVEYDDTTIEDLDLSMDENPISYFLTPAPLSDDEDLDMMDFDAGIEDAKHPTPIVRSVSPSSLEALRLPPPRPPTPPKSPSTPDLDSDRAATPDDDEEYIRFAAGRSDPAGFLLGPHDMYTPKKKLSDDYLSPASHPTAHLLSRGRATSRQGGSRPQGWQSRRSRHSWREPSPDVWSIEEEKEEETRGGRETPFQDGRYLQVAKAKMIDIKAAKPKKRVRFALPPNEVDE